VYLFRPHEDRDTFLDLEGLAPETVEGYRSLALGLAEELGVMESLDDRLKRIDALLSKSTVVLALVPAPQTLGWAWYFVKGNRHLLTRRYLASEAPLVVGVLFCRSPAAADALAETWRKIETLPKRSRISRLRTDAWIYANSRFS